MVATRPSAPPLMLLLDMRVDTPDEPGPEPDGSECTQSTQSPCGSTLDNAKSHATSSTCGTADNTESHAISDLRGSTLDNAESHARGGFNWDKDKGGFCLEWANLAEFDKWRRDEEHVYSIEFIMSTTQVGGKHWTWSQLFVCRCERSGGYVKQDPGRKNKIGVKKSGCNCEILIKQYPHTSTILGHYVAKHDHKVGFTNIAYLRLSGDARERIKEMLTKNVERRQIVSCQITKGLAADLIHFAGTRDSHRCG